MRCEVGQIEGVITGRDVVRHALLITREFGVRVLCAAVWSVVMGKRVTFLELVMRG